MLANIIIQDTKDFEPISYLNNSVWCRLAPSKISSVGVFAIRDIPVGTYPFLCANMFEITKDQLGLLDVNVAEYLKDMIAIIDGKLKVISPNMFADYKLYLNHSEDPNYDCRIEKTIKNITKGTELTTNYKWIVENCEQFSYWDFIK